jgi:glutamate---methylamine ligase
MQAGVLAAGLDGIAQKRDPGKRLDLNMYEEGHTLKDVRRLPLNLLDALRAFAGSTLLRTALGAEFADSYVKLRMADWNDYMRHLTQWERDRTLDT